MKYMEEFIFSFKTNDKILLQTHIDFHGDDDVAIRFFYNSENIILARDCFSYLLKQFKDMLQAALKRELILHSSISNDIGYVWEEVLRDKGDGIIFEEKGKEKFWIGLKYLLWSTPNNENFLSSTWIYNDQEGNIIFKITPGMKNIFTASSKKFEQFMKSYKPFFVTIINDNTAQQWLEQVDALIQKYQIYT